MSARPTVWQFSQAILTLFVSAFICDVCVCVFLFNFFFLMFFCIKDTRSQMLPFEKGLEGQAEVFFDPLK